MLLVALLISLQKQFTGLNISAGLTQPEQTGGDTQDISVFGGFGDIDENGFNVLVL